MGLFEIIVVLLVIGFTAFGIYKLKTEIAELFKNKVAYKIGVILTGLAFITGLIVTVGDFVGESVSDTGKAFILAASAILFYGVTFAPASQRKVDKEDNIQEKF